MKNFRMSRLVSVGRVGRKGGGLGGLVWWILEEANVPELKFEK